MGILHASLSHPVGVSTMLHEFQRVGFTQGFGIDGTPVLNTPRGLNKSTSVELFEWQEPTLNAPRGLDKKQRSEKQKAG